jgi:hypothetical protein
MLVWRRRLLMMQILYIIRCFYGGITFFHRTYNPASSLVHHHSVKKVGILLPRRWLIRGFVDDYTVLS